MYNIQKASRKYIAVDETYEGETIEKKIQRLMNNKEPIGDSAPLIYTDRSEGILPGFNIKTDRFEVAIEALDRVTKATRAKRENKPSIGEQAKEGMKKESGEKDGGPEPIQTTN